MNATLINLFHVCRRELWLHHHGIRMEHTSEVVYEGKLVGESTYGERPRKNKQIELDGVKIDFYDPKEKIVYETKKSNKTEHAHIAQVKYYLYVLHQNGIVGAMGIIEYPKLRLRTQVFFDSGEDIPEIEKWIEEIEQILNKEKCPLVQRKPICNTCSYYEYCYVDEL